MNKNINADELIEELEKQREIKEDSEYSKGINAMLDTALMIIHNFTLGEEKTSMPSISGSNIYKDLKLEIHHFFDCEKEDEIATREEIMAVIDRLKEMPIQPLPSADVVEVVRCKDCKHSEYREDYGDYECEASGCGLVYNADFYCADGERKETE